MRRVVVPTVSTLADRANTTEQAMAEPVAHLEERTCVGRLRRGRP
ncbi:MAG TPA: hypothetical protein VER97_17310 [Geodermatophilus sp.]|nr:hypothetical protein [Geodermatophilus sp.]